MSVHTSQKPFTVDCDKITGHMDHCIECVNYGDWESVTVECMDCRAIICDIADEEPRHEILALHVGHEMHCSANEVWCDDCELLLIVGTSA